MEQANASADRQSDTAFFLLSFLRVYLSVEFWIEGALFCVHTDNATSDKGKQRKRNGPSLNIVITDVLSFDDWLLVTFIITVVFTVRRTAIAHIDRRREKKRAFEWTQDKKKDTRKELIRFGRFVETTSERRGKHYMLFFVFTVFKHTFETTWGNRKKKKSSNEEESESLGKKEEVANSNDDRKKK